MFSSLRQTTSKGNTGSLVHLRYLQLTASIATERGWKLPLLLRVTDRGRFIAPTPTWAAVDGWQSQLC